MIFRKCRLPSKDTTMTGDEKYDTEKTTCQRFDPKLESRLKICSAKPNVIQIYNEKFELIKELRDMGHFGILGSDEKYIYVYKKYQPKTHSILILKYLITDFIKGASKNSKF